MLRPNEQDSPSFWRRAVTSAGLSLLFLVVYGGANSWASRQPNCGSCYFNWERAIPFVPFFIVPYLSIDLFFITAPFLCATQTELAIYARRVALSIIVAGSCFVLWPLTFAFDRPAAAGVNGALFDWFRTLDAPHNLAPSLHAALLVLMWPIFARGLSGIPRAAVMSWFCLIALSPVLTYQHHVIDIVTGAVLALVCVYLVQDPQPRVATTGNWRATLYYSTGAAALMFGAWAVWPWGAFLLWPATALLIVAAGYFGVGPDIYRKRDGLLSPAARLVLGPVLIGQYLSLRHYQRHCRKWDEVTPQIWIGRWLRQGEAEETVTCGVTAVLDLSAEFSEPQSFRGLRYCNMAVLDLTAPTLDQLDRAADFINEEARRGIVYVHCKIGYSRSTAAIGAALLKSGEVEDPDEVMARLRRARPSIIIRPEIQRALYQFHASLKRALVNA